MTFYGKEYQFVKNDDKFEAYVKSLELPADSEASYINSKPVIKVEKNGDTFTSTFKLGEEVFPVTFKSGVEFDDSWGELKFKSTYVVDGNTINHVNVRDGKKNYVKSEFTDKDLKETLSGDNFDGVAVRYYKAV